MLFKIRSEKDVLLAVIMKACHQVEGFLMMREKHNCNVKQKLLVVHIRVLHSQQHNI